MKKIGLMVFVLQAAVAAHAQQPVTVYARSTQVLPQQLSINYQKTTSLIFPSAIKSVDRGSADVIVQKAGGVENVLKLKAGKQHFEETNLSVITADGQFYGFNVSYGANPPSYTMMIKPSSFSAPADSKAPAAATIVFSEHLTNETRLKKLAAQASISPRNITNIRDEAYGIAARLTGLYIAEDKFFYTILLDNTSHINYDIEALNFYVRDRKKVKRMATQEIRIEPVMVIGNTESITGKSRRMLIAVLPKQTIAAGKRLVIELQEANGGRGLTCTLKNNTLLKAMPISITAAVDNIPNVLSAGK